jgi:lysophospholipase L1-like esterase
MSSSSATQTSSSSVPLEDGMVVACLGESLTKGEVSYDWVSDLQSRPQNASIHFVNLGVGGDHSYNALKRVDQVVQCRPNKVVVLIGAGDAICTMSATRDRVFRIWKRLPQKHSLEWFNENIRQIADQLKSETTARVALCSLPLAGEDPESEINRRAREYSMIVKQIADEQNVSYIPFYERMHEEIAASPGRALTPNFLYDFLSECQAAFRILILHKNLDEVGQQSGSRFHVDGLHLNSRSGKILADLVQEFVASQE